MDANLQGSFDFLGRTHELSIGANYRRDNHDDGPGGWPSSFPYQFDPFSWQTSIDVPMPAFNYLWERQANAVNYGAYATAKFNIADPLAIRSSAARPIRKARPSRRMPGSRPMLPRPMTSLTCSPSTAA
ncbi:MULTISPECIES: hypothetical protein [unclassified Shinella]|uniref:hypothetical protein n=1 Tax=unclassified Shinella TaxID=2643062 RepID=UPI00225D299C|nr:MULTISPECIES: hypothetical protein [unclassified Shinella]MCO5140136.1 hypothetical protein [Shinella sp.]MDC7256845.1 hypothetical protein [Shinella sp. YE25]CAI0339732.1 hypothetical protein SHINE37_43586 [Rhizobiaceae bacterium]CAK7258123.1 protein of unknown function [Shinella sp. WSC3-e]